MSGGLSGAIGGSFDSTPTAPDSESTSGFAVIDKHFGGVGSGLVGSIVFHHPEGLAGAEAAGAIDVMLTEAASVDGVLHVGGVDDLTVSADGTIAYSTVSLTSDVDATRAIVVGEELRVLAPELPGLDVEVGGLALAAFEPPQSEMVGLAIAVVVLIVAFGSVLAMGLPIGVAIGGVGIGVSLVTILSNVIPVPDFATILGLMLGLGVGIDYALFIVTRYRELLRAGATPEEATTTAMSTAGRSVIFASITVVLSLLGMVIIGIGIISGLAIGAALTVLITMLASITLLPAALGFVGERIEVTRYRGLISAGLVAVTFLAIGLKLPTAVALVAIVAALVVLVAGFFVPALRRTLRSRPERPVEQTLAHRWSEMIQRRPMVVAVLTTGLLLLLTLPVFSLRFGFSDESTFPAESDTKQAYDLLVEGFGPGFNGPLVIAAELRGPDDLSVVEDLHRSIASVDGVASVAPVVLDDPTDPQAALIQVFPSTGPQSEETQTLVTELRENLIPALPADGPDVHVTGVTAANIDFSDYLAGRTLWFFAAVLGLSFLLLLVVFRSILVPLKAVFLNLMSIGAAYGVVVAIFQWGWGASLVGLGGGAPIEPFIPMMMFAIVFGLSMDYEVFLLSRIKEDYLSTGDPQRSVSRGLALTASVITAAALIMVVVFGSFILETNRLVKLLGTGLAVAVLVDATLVRMLLLPATMELLGHGNWWLPRWLDRLIPKFSIEAAPVVGMTDQIDLDSLDNLSDTRLAPEESRQ